MKRLTIIAAIFLVEACSVLGEDFDKAVFIGKLNPTQRVIREEVKLRRGMAELIVVVPGWMCESPKKTAMLEVSVAGPGVRAIHRTISLDRVRWSYANGSCNAFGYQPDGNPLSIDVQSDEQPVLVEATLQEGSVADMRLWFIYGGRVPGTRIYQ